MLAKKHRFYGQGAIRYLNRRGTPIRGSLCTLKYVKNRNSQNYRAAVVVSKKVTKSAPKRNRIRRRVYEIIRLQGAEYMQGYDVAVIVFSDKLVTMTHDELSDMLRDLFYRYSQVRDTLVHKYVSIYWKFVQYARWATCF